MCNVVVAGSGVGVSTGFGGVVGNGGIVIMPDPFDYLSPIGDFTVIPYTSTIVGWSLEGDLSIQTAAIPPTAPIQTATGFTVNIESYNKNLRVPSESTAPSLSTMARSKGRVLIGYSDTATFCGGSIQFDVLKEYMDSSYVPPIVGPNCWLPDSTYTYSVDQIASDNLLDGIGLDQYYWYIQDSSGAVIPPSLFYSSADKSSITLDAPSVLASPYTITTCYGRANPWDGNTLPFPGPLTHQKCVSKIIGGQPLPPVISVSSCINIGDTGFTASIVSPVGGYGYVWTATNPSWLLMPDGLGHNLDVSALGDGPGVLSVTVTNGGCNSSVATDTVHRNFVAPNVSLSGDTCISAGTSNVYSVLPSGVQANPTCWQLPSGWGISYLNGTHSVVSITVPAGTPAGRDSIMAYACDCPGGVVSIYVNVRPANPVIAGGLTCIDFGDTSPQVYSVTPPGTYNWSIPGTWSGFSNTDAISVTPDGVSTGAISVYGVGINGCNSLSGAVWNVDFNPIAPDTATVGCFNFGVAGTTTVTIANAPLPFFGNYTVSTTPGGLLTGYSVDPLTGEITLNTSASAASGGYTLHITHTTVNCGSSTTLNVPVTVNAPSSILTLTPVGTFYDLYQVLPPVPNATYEWFLDSVAVPMNNQAFLGLTGPSPGPTTVCVNILDTVTGCIGRLCIPGGTHSRSASVNNGQDGINVLPNPNNGDFRVEVPAFKTAASLRIINSEGRELGTYPLRPGQNSVNGKDLVPGSYYLLIALDDQPVVVRKMQVSQR
jgi:hypothetical protein